MTWYLIQTKPRAENIALENLSNQGYECYLPMLTAEKLLKNKIERQKVPLFPRYLFINLELDFSSKGWAPIRSTKGVTQLVRFGVEPAKVDAGLINLIRARELQDDSNIEPLFRSGESLKVLCGPFAGFESIYQGMDPQMRVIVLLEFMNKNLEIRLQPDQVRVLK